MERPTASHQQIIAELKAYRDQPLPVPQDDWDLIWVLSGPEITLDKALDGRRNENRDRILTGMELVGSVTSLRAEAPHFYFNGTEEHNDYLRRLIAEGQLESDYNFPGSGLDIAPVGTNIIHTGHQFARFPAELLEGTRKVVIVSSVRHLPRVRRYIGLRDNPFLKLSPEQIILYPALPLNFPYSGTRREIKVIPEYQEKGLIVKEN